MDTRQRLELQETRQPIDATDADLSGSIFTNVSLAGAAFNDVKLTGASIRNACLSGARIEDANLSETRISQANLTRVAITDCATDGMTIDGILLSDLITAYRNRVGKDH